MELNIIIKQKNPKREQEKLICVNMELNITNKQKSLKRG